ncbi:MAG: amidohydrolase family protein [Fimbriimonadaceae bacterium]|nr:amidohydrolase family protein [Fimbriimonadaceae bacterium]
MAAQPFIVDSDIHNVVAGKSIQHRLAEPHRSRFASGNRGPGHLGYWNPNGVMRADTKLPDGRKIENQPETLVEHVLEPYGISYGILNPGGMGLGLCPDADYANALLAAENAAIAEEWLTVDRRLKGSILVNPNDPEAAAAEIHRWGDHPDFVQVLLPSGARMGYGQRYFNPIYAAACDHGLPVAIHPGTEGVGLSGAPTAAGYPSTYFEWHTDLAGSYLAHLVSLVAEGTFQRFPALRFILVEGGVSWLPPILWRLDKNWKALRLSTPWLERPPSETVCEHVFLTTQPIEEPPRREQLHQLLAMFPAERMLLFSSDFPHWDGDTPDFAARQLPEALRARVLGQSAAELYGLPGVVHA